LTKAVVWWPAAEAGEIVWCHFPERIEPGPKPRPALVVTVFDDQAPRWVLRVAYGTSKNTDSLRRGEFLISDRDAAAYGLAGLSYPTKFSFQDTVDLPYNSDWFKVPPGAPNGQTPKLGMLHPCLMRRVRAAWEAAQGA
jgi:hypothetical protein